MGAAIVAIPLAAMLLPIVLILVALLIDVFLLGVMGYRMWHDEWAVRVGHFTHDHISGPIHRLTHRNQATPRFG